MTYYKYKAAKRGKYEGLSSSFATAKKGIQSVLDERKAERAANEKTKRKTSKKLSKLSQNKSQSLGTYVAKSGGNIRDFLYDKSQSLYSNQLSSTGFTVVNDNIQDGLNTFASVSEGYDVVIENYNTRQNNGEGRFLEGYYAKQFAKSAEIEHRELFPVDNGTLYSVYTDPTSGQVDESKTLDVGYLGRLAHSEQNSINLQYEIGEDADKLGTFKQVINARGVGVTSGVEAMQALGSGFEQYVEGLQTRYTTNSNVAAETLADNSIYEEYDDNGNMVYSGNYFAYDDSDVTEYKDENGATSTTPQEGYHPSAFNEDGEFHGKPINQGVYQVTDQYNDPQSVLTSDQDEKVLDMIEGAAFNAIGIQESPKYQYRTSDATRNKREDDVEVYNSSMSVISDDPSLLVNGRYGNNIITAAEFDGDTPDIILTYGNGKKELIKKGDRDDRTWAMVWAPIVSGQKTSTAKKAFKNGERYGTDLEFEDAPSGTTKIWTTPSERSVKYTNDIVSEQLTTDGYGIIWPSPSRSGFENPTTTQYIEWLSTGGRVEGADYGWDSDAMEATKNHFTGNLTKLTENILTDASGKPISDFKVSSKYEGGDKVNITIKWTDNDGDERIKVIEFKKDKNAENMAEIDKITKEAYDEWSDPGAPG